MQAVIMAGGKGTRLFSVTQDLIPKPMVPFCGRPLIEYLIKNLVQSGITDIIVCLGHMGEQISAFLGDGARYGVQLHYVQETTPLGSAGALALAKPLIKEDFVLAYADLLLDVDFQRMYRFHLERKAAATLFVHPNAHPYDSDLVLHDADDRVTGFAFKDAARENDYTNCVNAGVVLLRRDTLDYFGEPKKLALEKGLLRQMLQDGKAIYAYRSTEYVKDVGTPDRLAETERAYLAGRPAQRNLTCRQKAVFLDRDGTINEFRGLITEPEQMQLADGAATAIRKLNASAYLTLVVTNQPVIARGDCTLEQLDAIHRRMETLLGNDGAFLDDLIYCPHHPDKGYPGERPEYKIDCDCRKPKIGMIREMAARHNVELAASWMVGDTYRDIQTGKNAGLRAVLVCSKANPERERFSAEADYIVDSLQEAVRLILSKDGNEEAL